MSADRPSARGYPSLRRLRVGPVAVEVLDADGRGHEAIDRLLASFEPASALDTPRAKVVVSFEALDLGVRGLEPYSDVHFTYAPALDAYVFENESVRLRMTSDASGTWLVAQRDLRESLAPSYGSSMLRTTVAVGAYQADALLVHGCAMVSPDDHAVLFLGASEDGKTTMVRRLPGWTTLADDTVLLEACPDEACVWVSGTLFAGNEQLPRRGERHVLRHLFVLSPHAPDLSTPPMTEAEAFGALTRRVFCPLTDGPIPARVVDLAERVALRVPASVLASSLHHDPSTVVAELASTGGS